MAIAAEIKSDLQLAEDVARAIAELNRAIVAAHGAGLRVEVDHIFHQNINERWQRQMFSADVTRKVESP